LLSLDEIFSVRSARSQVGEFGVLSMSDAPNYPTPGANSDLLFSAASKDLGKRLLSHYGGPNAKSLTRKQSRIPQETFDALDKNRDGKLDARELERIRQRPRDAILKVRLGKNPDGKPMFEVKAPKGNSAVR